MTDLLSILCEAAGDFDELEDPRRAKKPKLGVSAKGGVQTRPASLSRHQTASRVGQGQVMSTSQRQGVSDPKTRNGVCGAQTLSASAPSPKARAMSSQLYSSTTYARSPPPTGLIFAFEDRDGGNGPSSPSGSLDSSSVTSAMDEGANGLEEVGSSSEDDELTYGTTGQMLEGSGTLLGGSSGNALLNSKKRKRVTKQSSRRAKPLTVEILYQIFEKLGIQKENVNGTYKLVLPTLKSAECSSVYFAVTEWQCFRKRIMNHGFEIVHEQQSSWIRVRPNLASPDGRLIFEDLELRRRYGTPCKIKNARERNEIFELPVLELDLSSFDDEQQSRSPSPDLEDHLSSDKADSSRGLDASIGGLQQQSSHTTFGSQNFQTSLGGAHPQPSSPRTDDVFQNAVSYEMYESAGDEHDFSRPGQTIGLNFGSKRNRRRGTRRASEGAAAVTSLQHSMTPSSSSSSCDDEEDNMVMEAFEEEGDDDERSMSWQSADEDGSRVDQRYLRSSTEMKEERGSSGAGRNGLGGFGASLSVASSPFSVASSPNSSSNGISAPLSSSWVGAGGYTRTLAIPSSVGSTSTFGTPRSPHNNPFTSANPLSSSSSVTSPSSTLSMCASNATSLASSVGNLPPTSLASSPLGSSPLITSFFSSINLSGTPHFNLPSFSSVLTSSPAHVNSLSESEFTAQTEETRAHTTTTRVNSKQSIDSPKDSLDLSSTMDIDHSPRRIAIAEPTQQLEGALRHCFRLPLVARELLSNGHFSLSNGQFDIQVTMKHSPAVSATSPAQGSQQISFGPSPSSPLSASLPRFPPFSAISGNSPTAQ